MSDYIDRDELNKEIVKMIGCLRDMEPLSAVDISICIAKAPSADVRENIRGEWILSGGYFRCSLCGEKALLKLDKSKGGSREYEPQKTNFCPYCGAKMEKKGETPYESTTGNRICTKSLCGAACRGEIQRHGRTDKEED